MKANNIPKVSDLSRWIDLQLSTITDGVSSGYTLGNGNTVWIDKGATVFNVSFANGETVEIDSDNYNTAEEIAKVIILTINNTTMNANETLTDRQNAVGYYDEDYNDCLFSSVDEAFEYVKAHSDDHTEKELNGGMLFGFGVYAYADIVTVSGVADCSRSNELFYHFKDDSEIRRFIQYLKNTDGFLVSV